MTSQNLVRNIGAPNEAQTFFLIGGMSEDEMVTAAYEETDAAVLWALSVIPEEDMPYDVPFGLAGNENTPQSVLGVLANDDNYDVRKEVGGNRSTPAAVLALMASSSPEGQWGEDIRVTVAGNPFTPLESLLVLAENDEEYGMRYEDQREKTVLYEVFRNQSPELHAYRMKNMYRHHRLNPDPWIYDHEAPISNFSA